MPRKPRSDSIEAQKRTAQKNTVDLIWPDVVPAALEEAVRLAELDIYDRLVETRSAEDWTALDLVNAARYAGHLAQQIKDEDMLKRSGSLIRSPKNNEHFIRNPLVDVVSSRQATVNQLSRQLGVSLPAVDKEVLKNNAINARGIEMSKEDSYLTLLAGGK